MNVVTKIKKMFYTYIFKHLLISSLFIVEKKKKTKYMIQTMSKLRVKNYINLLIEIQLKQKSLQKKFSN